MSNVNEKYLDIVRAGKHLFWKHGLKKVSIENICQEAGTSRATFYKYFDNKENIAIYIIKSVIDQAMADYEKIMSTDMDFETKVRKTIDFKIKTSNDISKEFLKDLYSGEYIELDSYYRKATEDSIKMVRRDFEQAQYDGYIRMDVKIEFLLYFLNKLGEMVNDDILLSLYGSTSELIGELMKFFFYGVMSDKRKH